MKKLITYILILALISTFAACAAADQPIADLNAFKEQVFADYLDQYYPGAYPHQKPTKFDTFRYYGTDHGYHILLLRTDGVHSANMENINIGASTFVLGSGLNLEAYKNGKFTDLRIAYREGLVSAEAIAKAAELHAARKNATD